MSFSCSTYCSATPVSCSAVTRCSTRSGRTRRSSRPRSVDTLIKRLRKKIEANPAEPAVILTVWGGGYKAADV